MLQLSLVLENPSLKSRAWNALFFALSDESLVGQMFEKLNLDKRIFVAVTRGSNIDYDIPTR